jgi:hypothetical protein
MIRCFTYALNSGAYNRARQVCWTRISRLRRFREDTETLSPERHERIRGAVNDRMGIEPYSDCPSKSRIGGKPSKWMRKRRAVSKVNRVLQQIPRSQLPRVTQGKRTYAISK